MEGKSKDSEPGLVYRVFQKIQEETQKNNNLSYEFVMENIQIYNEEIYDLYTNSDTPLKIIETPKGKSKFRDGNPLITKSMDEVVKRYKEASKNRIIGMTKLNDSSSRSHSITLLTINKIDLQNLEKTSSQLYLVDLAGSERACNINGTGKQFVESKNINLSLTTLGKVINILSKKNTDFVPYRDSKLTFLLKNSFGGNSVTFLILNISLNENHYEVKNILKLNSNQRVH